jgi:hypothetical protein
MLEMIVNSVITIIAFLTIYYSFLNRKRLKRFAFLLIPIYLLVLSGLNFFNLEIPETIEPIISFFALFFGFIFISLGSVAFCFSETNDKDIKIAEKRKKLAERFGMFFFLSTLIVIIVSGISLFQTIIKFLK